MRSGKQVATSPLSVDEGAAENRVQISSRQAGVNSNAFEKRSRALGEGGAPLDVVGIGWKVGVQVGERRRRRKRV